MNMFKFTKKIIKLCLLSLIIFSMFSVTIKENKVYFGNITKLRDTRGPKNIYGYDSEQGSQFITESSVGIVDGFLEPAYYLHNYKLILLWSNFWGRNWSTKVGEEVFQSCKFKYCQIAVDKKLLNVSSALVVHSHGTEFMKTEPPQKYPNQVFVYATEEPPVRTPGVVKPWRGVFNWTMTYRSTADIQQVYGMIINKEEKYIKYTRPPKHVSKNRSVAWIATRCTTHGKREKYIKKLKRYIDVDVFGGCGKTSCGGGRGYMGKDCTGELRKYYFYLAFENSFCKEYITEKFFKILPLDVVPVVRGGGNYTSMVPHKWYINTADFSSPEALAEYLKFLINNPTEYKKYFEKKNNYKIIRNPGGWCSFCEKLHDKNIQHKVYENVNDVHSSSKDCRKPSDF